MIALIDRTRLNEWYNTLEPSEIQKFGWINGVEWKLLGTDIEMKTMNEFFLYVVVYKGKPHVVSIRKYAKSDVPKYLLANSWYLIMKDLEKESKT